LHSGEGANGHAARRYGCVAGRREEATGLAHASKARATDRDGKTVPVMLQIAKTLYWIKGFGGAAITG
jgi:hypothetical protein